MKHYYLTDPSSDKGFVEVTEEEFNTIVGTEETRPYTTKVYCGELSIEEVPEDLRTAVQAVVDAKIARWGEYKKQEVPAEELKKMIEEAV
jgi:hypothetical protein